MGTREELQAALFEAVAVREAPPAPIARATPPAAGVRVLEDALPPVRAHGSYQARSFTDVLRADSPTLAYLWVALRESALVGTLWFLGLIVIASFSGQDAPAIGVVFAVVVRGVLATASRVEVAGRSLA